MRLSMYVASKCRATVYGKLWEHERKQLWFAVWNYPDSWWLRWSRGSVLAFGTQVRGFKPDRSCWIFRGEKILSTPSFGGELKPLSHVVDLRHVKDPWMLRGSRAFSGKIQRPFLAHVVPPLAAGISWRLTFENKKVHKYLHLWPLGSHRRRLAVRSGTSKGSAISQYGCSRCGTLATEA